MFSVINCANDTLEHCLNKFLSMLSPRTCHQQNVTEKKYLKTVCGVNASVHSRLRLN